VRTLINFTKEFLGRYLDAASVERMLACFENPKIVPAERQQSNCKQLLRRIAASADETEFALNLGLLLLALGRCGSQEIENDYVSTVVEYINRNFAEITSIGQIAEAFFVSKYHLCRVFKNAMKVTLIEYLNQVKIKNARQLLEFSDREVGDIAEACGFNSVAYFSNVFKKITGSAPSEYRKNTRGDK
jgi:YesN/AraC family two-component response regulator